MNRVFLALMMLLTVACATPDEGDQDEAPATQVAVAKAGARAKGGSSIVYHGGPVVVGTKNVYYLWYGGWAAGNTTMPILTDLAQNLGGSPYFNINTTYYDSTGTHVQNGVAYGGDLIETYPLGTSLTDAQVAQLVTDALSWGSFPTDPDGVYFVLTASDIDESSGFCTQYCGWHNHTSFNGVDIKYAFVGDPDRCPSACEAQTTSPNGDAGADGMASIVAHELEEATTDPDLNAWYDRRGNENADKCAWTFGAEYTTANGAKANMKLGTRDYLIQQNWVNSGSGFCALSH